ncbi:MAG: hypothetical protein ACFNZW_06705 [Coriobacteriaceae bacterium]
MTLTTPCSMPGKACRRFGQWEAVNCKKKRLKLFSKMKTGLEVVPRPEQHT